MGPERGVNVALKFAANLEGRWMGGAKGGGVGGGGIYNNANEVLVA